MKIKLNISSDNGYGYSKYFEYQVDEDCIHKVSSIKFHNEIVKLNYNYNTLVILNENNDFVTYVKLNEFIINRYIKQFSNNNKIDKKIKLNYTIIDIEK